MKDCSGHSFHITHHFNHVLLFTLSLPARILWTCCMSSWCLRSSSVVCPSSLVHELIASVEKICFPPPPIFPPCPLTIFWAKVGNSKYFSYLYFALENDMGKEEICDISEFQCRDILVRIRIRILGSVPMTNVSGILVHLYCSSKIKSHKEVTKQ